MEYSCFRNMLLLLYQAGRHRGVNSQILPEIPPGEECVGAEAIIWL